MTNYFYLSRFYSPFQRQEVEDNLQTLLDAGRLGSIKKEVFMVRDDDGPQIHLEVIVKTEEEKVSLYGYENKPEEYKKWAAAFSQINSASLFYELTEKNKEQALKTKDEIAEELGIDPLGWNPLPYQEIRISAEPKKSLLRNMVCHLGLFVVSLFPPKYNLSVHISDPKVEKILHAKPILESYGGRARLQVSKIRTER